MRGRGRCGWASPGVVPHTRATSSAPENSRRQIVRMGRPLELIAERNLGAPRRLPRLAEERTVRLNRVVRAVQLVAAGLELLVGVVVEQVDDVDRRGEPLV